MDLNQYKKGIKEIKAYAFRNKLHDEEVNKIFEECFQLMEIKTSTKIVLALKILKFFSIVSIIVVTGTFLLYNHPTTHNIFLRNLQNYIYPVLKFLRNTATPIITILPSMTVWYDEWCILENPYFRVNEMDCRPCSNANAVQNKTGYNITSFDDTGVPHMRQEPVNSVNLRKLTNIYRKYQDVFDKDARKITTNAEFTNINDMMTNRLDINPSANKDIHITWRLTRMEPGRKLRNLFPKPQGVPDWWSPSTEKFIFIDELTARPYNLPNPECANVVIQCFGGERLIHLNPSPECTQSCKKLTIVLKNQQSLWYNWWYWRPESFPPDNATGISIMHLMSFC